MASWSFLVVLKMVERETKRKSDSFDSLPLHLWALLLVLLCNINCVCEMGKTPMKGLHYQHSKVKMNKYKYAAPAIAPSIKIICICNALTRFINSTEPGNNRNNNNNNKQQP